MVDEDRKIIFGWSAKCGCSHIKTIFWFLQKDVIINHIHKENNTHTLPVDITNYTTLIFCRNPYKRIVSGFLDKYKANGEFRHLWKNSFISFSQFVDEVIKNNFSLIEKHHFIPQTKENYNDIILSSKIIKFYDISNIDYKYIEELYNKKIPECVLSKTYGHERSKQINSSICVETNVYDLNIDEYIDNNVNIKYFYNKEIQNKVFNFYIDDFNLFYKNGIDYINSYF